MKTLKILIIILVAFISQPSQAQFLKKLAKHAKEAAERTVDRRAQRETSKKTDKTLDKIFKKKKKRKRRKHDQDTQSQESKENPSASERKINRRHSVNSKKDFVSGNKVIFQDTFKNDAIGDFPVTWNTNSSGEVVTFNTDNTKWLQFALGEYTPDGITQIPENCTFEFDLSVSDNFDFYSEGLTLNLIAVKDRRKDFMKWSRFSTDKNGVRLRIKPKNFEYKGETAIQTYLDGDKIIGKTKNNEIFTMNNNTVHVALWRQKTRLRVYLNDKKIWDIPRAFGNANYNAISFNTSGKEEEHFYISNLRLATAGKDMRHALLETGTFVTNDILFDVNKAIIKPSSFNTLDELGQLLQNNPNVSIRIIGHTDSDGSSTSNQLLSEKRAIAIKTYLNDTFQIANQRMKTLGKGESEPIASNTTAQGKAKNRRVVFEKL